MIPSAGQAVLTLVLTVGLNTDGPSLPAIEELIACLEASEATTRNLSVTTEYVKLENSFLPVDKPVRLKLTTKFIVDCEGRSWYEGVGEQVSTGLKPEDVRISHGRWQTTFDGKAARSLEGGSDGVFHWGGIDDYPAWHGVNPLEFTTHYFAKPVSKILKESSATVVGQTQWESRPVAIVDTKPVVKKQSRKLRFWIDPARRVVVRRAALIQFAPDQQWQEYTRTESREHKEAKLGAWLPTRTKYEALHVTKDMTPEHVHYSFEGRNSDWKVNSAIPAETFRLDFPENVLVTDRRQPKPNQK